jgi:hypothetical protein
MSGEAPLDEVGVVDAAGVFGEADRRRPPPPPSLLGPSGDAAEVLLSGLIEAAW